MKYGRLIFVTISFALSFILLGMLYRSYAINFDNYYYQPINGITKGEYEDSFNRIVKQFNNSGVEVFTVDYTSSKSDTSTIDVYCSGKIKKMLIEHDSRFEGRIGSLFGDKIQICYHDLSDYVNRANVYESINMYFVPQGDEERFLNLKIDEIEKFEPVKNEAELRDNFVFIYRALWILVLVSNILVCAVFLYFNRKEVVVQMCYGTPFGVLVWKAIISNLLMNVLLPLGLGLALFTFWNYLFEFKFLLLSFIAYTFVVITEVLCCYLFMNYRNVLQHPYGSKRMMTFCYVMRIFMLSVCIMILGFTAGKMTSLIDVYRQYRFYDKLKGYAQVFINENDIDDRQCEINDYNAIADASYYEPILIRSFCYFEDSDSKQVDVVMINKKAWELYSHLITDDAVSDHLTEGIWLIPDKYRDDEMIRKNIEYEQVELPGTIIYTNISPFRALGTNENNIEDDTYIVKDACVYLDMKDLYRDLDGFRLGMINNACFKISDEDVAKIIKTREGASGYSYTDIYEKFQLRISQEKRIAISYAACAVLLMLLDLLLARFIINAEHQINSMELVVKKITGMPLVYRYIRVYITTIIAGIVSISIAELMQKEFSMAIIASGVIFIALETIITIIISIKWERKQIQKILKGGAL